MADGDSNGGRVLKSVDCALDFCKQQLLFAIALITLTITIVLGISERASSWDPKLHSFMIVAWSLLISSVISGLLLLGRATEELRSVQERSVADVVVRLRLFAFGQFVLLMMGVLLLLACVGVIMLSEPQS